MNTNKVLVLYGSETGTAEDLAESIWRDFKRYGFEGSVMAMDDYDVTKLIYENLIIFICSTTGQGDPPSNMRKFWKFLLRKSLPSNSLNNSNVAVLGLGDSSYAKFNFAAKRLYKRLLSLGAEALTELGLCDEQHDLGHDAVLGPWRDKLWEALQAYYPFLRETRMSADMNSLLLRWKAIPALDETATELLDFPPGEPNERCTCLVRSNIRTTPLDHFQEVRLVTFEPVSDILRYNPGDVAYFRPHNSSEAVQQFLTLFSHRLPTRFSLESVHLPLPDILKNKILSLENVATVFWDLKAIPRRRVFEILSQVTTSDLEKEKLEEFLSPGGLDDLYSYCNRPRRTTLEVLADFPYASDELTLDHLFEIFQPIRPRAYSISSSFEAWQYDGPIIQILVAVVRYKTRLSTPRLGLASSWLATLSSGTVVLSVRPGALRFPRDSPVIMVGPGTGVAPFRSYISQRIALTFGKGDEEKKEIILFFGSRKKKSDFHFGEEFSKWHSSGDLTLITAFSRDQPEKSYVQHRIPTEGEKICQIVCEMGGYVFVAGSSKDMPMAVRQAFIDVLNKHSAMSTEESQLYLEKMENSGRYQEETWS